MRHDFKFLAFHFATHHTCLDVKAEYFDLFGRAPSLFKRVEPGLEHLDRGDPDDLLGFRGEECLR